MNREESTGKVNKGFFSRIRWLLVLYYFLILAATIVMMLVIYGGSLKLDWIQISVHFGLIFVLTFVSRLIWLVYMQVWRFGGIQSYMRLIVADACAFVPYCLLVRFVPAIATLSFSLCVSLATIYLLGCLTIRMAYRYAYKCVDRNTKFGHFVVAVIRIFAHVKLHQLEDHENQKIRVAIVGAGRVGTSLAQDLLNSPVAVYKPVCFIDSSEAKVGRVIYNLPVYMEDESVLAYLRRLDVQEIIFTLPQMEQEQKQGLYRKYTDAGYKVKVYDFPTVQATEEGGKRQLREFEPEELLFRRPQIMTDDATRAYYKDKTVLITGGGGSIGSELCRQIASMEPKRIVILDVYENGAYDIQQELRIRYGRDFPIYVEICSICNREALERVMAEHRPDYVIMAAAHKHVPIMEHNCIEAVENNVFGTLNTVQA